MRPRTMYRLTPPKGVGRVSYFEALARVIAARRAKGGKIDVMQPNVGLFRALWLKVTGSDYHLPDDYRVLAANVGATENLNR